MQKTKVGIILVMNFSLLMLTACDKKEAIPLQKVETTKEERAQEEIIEDIVVHVCGEVVQEGVYTLPANSRVYQAIEAAGGMKEDAASAYLNQAELLTDGQTIYVPTKEEAKQGQVDTTMQSQSDKINLNTATKIELMTLAGIGEAKAESIIKYRESNGRFNAIEDIKNISGIGDATFEKLKERLTI